jgi:hypothetical protein
MPPTAGVDEQLNADGGVVLSIRAKGFLPTRISRMFCLKRARTTKLAMTASTHATVCPVIQQPRKRFSAKAKRNANAHGERLEGTCQHH